MQGLSQQEFSILYESCKNTVYHFLLKLSGNPEIAEDLTQETFLKAFEVMDRFDPNRGSFSSWSCTIGKNLYFKHFNRTKKEFGNVSINIENFPELSDGNHEDPLDLEKNSISSALKQGVSSLPEPEKSIILLKEIQKKTLRETAEALGISERTVSRRLLSAFRILRTYLESEGIGL
ncbi:sigma-70 family RNA polymerase sigma factor [Leptospira langatensis]|uniref:Sigma-70 family RNA polymerase sigma factor n=1 Tax=Leptospira langatensis TaxID=2484983 RepID=A0A5F1ZVU6_9LEPT|nr:sigma-70 family RNA polymerase sigma factor [Leptospira langatensis]TGK01582.1 sigma-70 family RNA polymerase sigma factor [Leptospira langatensis]TGL41968.1 sigma-70 family RNA polymerase sigma factor [Leptospira langatensis]